jgi:anthranilate synthase component 2
MRILIIDNYDSFTYNLVHAIEKIPACTVEVIRNDKTKPNEITGYDKLVLSPGPGIPDEAGYLKEIIQEQSGKIPIFGVCLGLQAITEVFGGTLINLDEVYHGVATSMTVTQEENILFNDIPKQFSAGRYHSWAADPLTFPDVLNITAKDENGEIMAISHKTMQIHAVQFHPESVLTEHGQQIIENFIQHT